MIPPISASQIDKAQDCLRAWAFRYLTDLPKPPQEAGAVLGSEVHLVAENYLKKGTQPDRASEAGSIFIGGLPFLPPPGSGGVEGDFKIEIGGIWFTGIIDLVTRGSLLPQWAHGNIPVVVDHKTSADPKKYGLTADTLPLNPQALIYGFKTIANRDASMVGFRWIYYKTKGRPLTYNVDVCLPSREVFANFDRIVFPVAERLVELYRNPVDPNSLAPSPLACNKYRGCPYRGICKITPAELAVGLIGGNNMQTLKEKLAEEAARKGQIGAVQPGDGVNPPIPGRSLAPLPQVVAVPLPQAATSLLPSLPQAATSLLPPASPAPLPQAATSLLPPASPAPLPQAATGLLPPASPAPLPQAATGLLPPASSAPLPQAATGLLSSLPQVAAVPVITKAPKKRTAVPQAGASTDGNPNMDYRIQLACAIIQATGGHIAADKLAVEIDEYLASLLK